MKTKKNLLVACFVGLALTVGIAGTAMAYTPGDGITGSAHDLSARVAGEDRICAFCHTPHHATVDASADYMPLWSRDLGVANYDAYESSTFNAGMNDLNIVGTTDQLRGPSRLCMSCHDGSIAIDAYYGSPGDVTGAGMTDNDEYGHWGIAQTAGLSNDHPIGFDYASVAGVDTEIRDLSGLAFDSGVLVADVLYFDEGMTEDVMTCSTCHDVHNTANNEQNLLYGSQAGSSICLTCHAK